jgi:tetratricopeptide (TPR) repeat protein
MAVDLTPANQEVLQAPIPDDVQPEAPPEDEASDALLGMDAVQKRLLYASLLIKTGKIGPGLREYRTLVRKYPERDDVLAVYLQALVDLGRYAEAQGPLRKWLLRDPNNPDALRMAASIAMNSGQPAEASLYFEHLCRLRPGDPIALSDAAYARQEGGDDVRALRLFSESLDADPNQPEAREAVRELLLDLRPRLIAEASVLKQDSDTYTYASATGFSAPILDGTRLAALYEHVSVTRPQDDGVQGLDETLDHGRLQLTQRITRDLDLRIGAGAFSGFKDGFSQEAGLDWRPKESAQFSLDGKRNQPWYDEVEATQYRGSYDDVAFAVNGFWDDWGFYGEAGDREYYLSPVNHYGTRERLNAVISRKLFDEPETYASYSYYRTWFQYDAGDFRPLDMTKNEALHMFNLSTAVQLTPWFRAVLGGGVGKDEFKPKPTFVFSPSLEVKIGPRVEATAGFEYRSESERIGGGETLDATLGFRIVF